MAGFYDFAILALFYLDLLPRFPYHSALYLLLLLRLSSTWKWVEWQAYWIPRWIVSRSWQILKRPVYHVLTETQANHVQPWFALLLFGYFDERQCSLRISTLLNKIDTFLGWHTTNTFVAALTLIEWLLYTSCLCFWCIWGYHQGTLLQKRGTSLSRSY